MPALKFMKNGVKRIEASRRFLVSRGVVYACIKEEDPFAAKARQVRQGKIDRTTLMRHVQDQPDVYQRELAEAMGVTQAAAS